MSKTGRPNYRRKDRERSRGFKPEKRIVVDAVHRQRPDLRKLSRAMISMGIEVQAKASAGEGAERTSSSGATDDSDGKEADRDNQ
ncbi:hypothetical protein ACIHAX_28530 [Nocardia sp. NPDC051929]|uniref:hypothetical protein n=1 Tax=Nocardia sp. NPDC051929 TaxID=3364327 RepID=UPI0037C92CE5